MSRDKKQESKSGDLTPDELKEVWRRFERQLVHDAQVDVIQVKEGTRLYVLRQILHYAREVKRERLKRYK